MLRNIVIAVLVVEAIQLAVLAGVAALLGWRPAGVAGATLVLGLGTWAFVTLGLLLAGTLRAEAVLGAANLLWVLLLVAGGVVVPPDLLPPPGRRERSFMSASPVTIKPATGKLGILLPGMGAVATTFIAGVPLFER